MKKNLLQTLVVVSTGITMVACNSGAPGSNSSTNPSTQQGAGYDVYVKNESSDTIQVQKIRLTHLSPEHLQKAQLFTLQNAQLLAATAAPATSYAIAKGVSGFPANFYSNSSAKLIPLNQQYFGSCVTFSTVAGVSYIDSNYASTTDISPLDILDEGYEMYPTDISSTGWDGLPDASTLLGRMPNLAYYHNYNDTVSTYNALSTAYQNSGDTGDLTISQLTRLSGFSSQLSKFEQLAATSNGMAFSNVSNAWSQLASDYSTNNASIIKSALDNGNIVLIGFDVYDSSEAANSSACLNGQGSTLGSAEYLYNAASSSVNKISSAAASNYDAWTNPSGCVLGGHEVWIVGYSKSTSGQLIFTIRNSWGNSGDNGQYYMTDNYVNTAVNSITAVTKSVV